MDKNCIQELSKALETYKTEMDTMLETGSNLPVTKKDLHTFSVQLFYVLNEFKNIIEKM